MRPSYLELLGMKEEAERHYIFISPISNTVVKVTANSIANMVNGFNNCTKKTPWKQHNNTKTFHVLVLR